MKFDLRPCALAEVRALCEQYHGYQSASGTATYSFGVYEGERFVAAYAWQPPAPGAALSVCPEAPHAVLMLGWTPTTRSEVKTYEDENGRRVSPYSNGGYAKRSGIHQVGTTFIQRWEHWLCERGYAGNWLETHGWVREAIPGKVWRSGNPAFRYVRRAA